MFSGVKSAIKKPYAADGRGFASADHSPDRAQGDGADRSEDAHRCDQERLGRNPARGPSSGTHRERFGGADRPADVTRLSYARARPSRQVPRSLRGGRSAQFVEQFPGAAEGYRLKAFCEFSECSLEQR